MSLSLPTDIPGWIPGCAGIWLVACTWRGWKRGLVRQLISLLALALAVALGVWIGPIIAPAVPSIGFPQFLRPAVGALVFGVLLWGGITIVSSVIFRNTDDQDVGIVRTVYGISGALLGMASGLAVLGLACWGVRIAGSFADGLQKGAANKPHPPGIPMSPAEPVPLVSLKKAVEESPVGEWIKRVDPVPATLYPRLGKVGQVLTSGTARERLLGDPSFQVVSKNPKLIALKEDVALQQALQSGDVWSVMRHPKIQAAAADTQLLSALKALDIDTALDRALNPPDRAIGNTRSTTIRSKP